MAIKKVVLAYSGGLDTSITKRSGEPYRTTAMSRGCVKTRTSEEDEE
jgi:argininosuccinate synthase